MKLKEEHNEFAVKCFARFMKPSQVAETLIEAFPQDFPQPKPPELPSFQQKKEGIVYQFEKDEFVAQRQGEMRGRLSKVAGYSNAEEILTIDKRKFVEVFEDEFDQQLQKELDERNNQLLHKHNLEVEKHNKDLKAELSNQLRRLNIKHPQFPMKYRQLFTQTRDEFLQNHRTTSRPINENIPQELESIYGYVKEAIYQAETPNDAINQVKMAHTILKTLAAQNENDYQKQTDHTNTQETNEPSTE